MIKSILKGLVLSAIIAVPASAQIGWSLGLGPTLPQGDLGDGTKTGFHGMAGATFSIPAAPIKIRADFAYNTMKSEADDNLSLNVMTVSGDAQWSFMPGPLSPYLIGGVTWGSADLGGSSAPDVSAETDFGFNVGAGLDFGLGPLKLFAEGRYFSVGDSDFLPITVGLHF